MLKSYDAPSRSAIHARGDGPSLDPLEARLTAAEKQVSMALDTFDYDEIIAISSDALQKKDHTESKAVLKSRKNLLWARSHAYRHKRLHELALKDAKAALKIDPDDIAAYIRTAVLLDRTGYDKQALACLDRAQSLASRCEPASRPIWSCKIDRQRQKLLASHTHLFDRLPNELLIHVALHLSPRDRAAMSQTCRPWRAILTSAPHLWTTMIVNIKPRRLHESKAAEWLDHVSLCASRCSNSLVTAHFLGWFPSALLDRLLSILRASHQSLEDIKIPCEEQSKCYADLYRYCPRLETLEFSMPRHLTIQGTSLQRLYRPAASVESPHHVQDFSLKVFRSQSGGSIPELSNHMHSSRVLDGVDPFESRVERHVAAREEFFRSLATSLEEWTVDACAVKIYRQPIRLDFPKLVTLHHFDLNPNLEFTFPRLRELEVWVLRWTDVAYDQLTRILTSSPLLRTLAVVPGLERLPPALRQALRSLAHLVELELHCNDRQDVFQDILLPRTVTDGDAHTLLAFPLPKLQRLSIRSGQTDYEKLAFAILVREHMRAGENIAEARHLATEKLAVRENVVAPTVSPFARGSTTKGAPVSPEKRDGPRLDDTTEVSALQSLTLRGVGGVPVHVERVLRSVVPELVFQFDPL